MKPNGVTDDRGPLREEALQALRDAIGKVIADHKRLGLPLVIWRDGRVVEISPEEAEAEYIAAGSEQTDGAVR